MRNAPSTDIIAALQQEGAKVKAYDPKSMDVAGSMLKNVTLCRDVYSLAKGCDCLLILTEWEEFKQINFRKLQPLMRQTVIFDGRNILDKETLREYGFEYYGIGRGTFNV
jgi:UDPglucose 6-dehydrogenase